MLGTTRRRPLGSLVDPSGGGGGEEDGEEEEAAVGVAGPWRRAVGRSHSGDGELGRLLDARARMQQQHEATRTTVQSETAALMDSGVRVNESLRRMYKCGSPDKSGRQPLGEMVAPNSRDSVER